MYSIHVLPSVPTYLYVDTDERRMTVHMQNLSVVAAPFPTVHDIPNGALMQPPPRASQMGGVMAGTSGSRAHPCSICTKNTLVRARDRATSLSIGAMA